MNKIQIYKHGTLPNPDCAFEGNENVVDISLSEARNMPTELHL